MLPTNPHLRPVSPRRILADGVPIRRTTRQAQDSIPPVPDVDFPFFFDDFDYPADGVTPRSPSDPFVFRHPDRSLFGDNLWLTATGQTWV